ncbi:hypothetical protein ACFX1Z_044172 [Malus domestica]
MSFQDVQSGGGGRGRKASASPPQAVAAGIFQINTAVGTFRRMVDAIGTAKDTPDHRQKLHNTRQRILELVKETSAKLKSLAQSDRQSNVNPSKQIEDAKLARDFQTTLQEFQKVQQLASERESTYMPSLPTSAASASASGEYLEPSSSSTRDQHRQPFLQDQKRQELLLLDNEVAFNEAIIEEREQGIRDIEAQIGEASEIFKDLAVLIHEQGVVIDDIQSNIDNSSSATTQARVQLAKASKGVKFRCSWLSSRKGDDENTNGKEGNGEYGEDYDSVLL